MMLTAAMNQEEKNMVDHILLFRGVKPASLLGLSPFPSLAAGEIHSPSTPSNAGK